MPLPLLIPLAAAAAPTAYVIVTTTAVAATTSIAAAAAGIGAIVVDLAAAGTGVWYLLFKKSAKEISEEERKSLRRQNKMLKTRQLEAESIAKKTQQSADQSAENEQVLKAQELAAATLVLDASHKIALTATTLESVSLTNQESIETLSGALSTNIERHGALVGAALALPDKLEILTKELDDKTLLIESLNERIALFQTEVAAQETAMQEITNQMTGLVTLNHSQAETNHSQAKTIQTLEAEKAKLIENIHEMAEELELLSRPGNSKDNEQAFPNRFFR